MSSPNSNLLSVDDLLQDASLEESSSELNANQALEKDEYDVFATGVHEDFDHKDASAVYDLFEPQANEADAFAASNAALLADDYINQTENIQIRQSIGSKFLTAMLGLVVFTLAAVAFTSAFQSRSALVGSVTQSALVDAKTVGSLTQAFFVETIQPLKSLSLSHNVLQVAIAGSAAHVDSNGKLLSGEEIKAHLVELDADWKSANVDNPLFEQVFSNTYNWQTLGAATTIEAFLGQFEEHFDTYVTDKYGMLVSAVTRPSSFYHADTEWWQAAYNDGQGALFISQPSYNSAIAGSSFTIAVPIKDSLGNLWGILHSEISQALLTAHVQDFEFGETGYAVIINGNGESVVDPGPQFGQFSNRLHESVKTELLTGAEGSFTAADDQGENSLFAYSSIASFDAPTKGIQEIVDAVAKLNWTLYVRQKSSEALAVVNTILRWIIIVGVLSLIITTLVALRLTRGITNPLRQLALLSNRVSQGDLSQLADIRTNDEVGYLGQSFNNAIQRLRGIVQTEEERDEERKRREDLQANIGDFLDVAMDIADGDFTKRGSVSEDVLGNVVDAINLMIEEVANLLKDVQTTAFSVNEGSAEVLETTQAITSSTRKQAVEAQKAQEEVSQVTSSIRQMAENAQTSAQASNQALEASQQGQEAVTNTLEGMQNIRREVQAISKRIKSLGDRSLEISEIVDTISSISRQTNLLALNAAIEASGAGEAGRRFAIVADEVRKLADDSAVATRRIGDLIKGVQAEVQEVVVSVEDGTREVETGYRVATEAGQRLKEIGEISERSAKLAQAISQATQAQVDGVEQVGDAVVEIVNIAEQSQTSVDQGRNVAENLQDLANQLSSSLERFRLT